MRKIFLLFASLLVLSVSGKAAPVDVNTARRVAVKFWNSYRQQDNKPVEWMEEVMFDELPHLYVFVNGTEGFVVMSADDCVRPVLGYAFDASFPKELHRELRYWLGGYEEQIAYAVESGFVAPASVTAEWDHLLNAPVPAEPLMLMVVPKLCSTLWDQSAPYNLYCPYDSTYHDLAVVGCTATAMAQIMKYWNHPMCGTGSHSYNHRTYGVLSADFANTTYRWSDMRNHARYIYTDQEMSAVATLSYHCGVSVEMDYGPSATGGSGAYTIAPPWGAYSAQSAFVNNFKYDPSIASAHRVQTSDEDWIALIDTEMAARRPILYSGYDSDGGHAFVLDGADTLGRYHFNWGWSGSGDGYYTVDNLAPGSGGAGGNGTYTFNDDQGILYRIFPVPETFDTVDFYDTICRTISEYHFHDFVLPVSSIDTLLPHLNTYYNIHLHVIRSNYVVLDPNGAPGMPKTVSYCSRDGLTFLANPFSKENCRFLGWCRNADGEDSIYQPGDFVMIDRNWTYYAIWQDTSLAIPVELEEMIDIWPNPTTDEISVSVPEHIEAISVMDVMGRTVIREDYINAIAGTAKISLRELPEGAYTVQVKAGDEMYKRRIIKQ